MSQQTQGSHEGDKPLITSAGGEPTQLIGEHGSPRSPTSEVRQTPLFDEGTFSPPSTGYQPYQQDVSSSADVVGGLSPTPVTSGGVLKDQGSDGGSE